MKTSELRNRVNGLATGALYGEAAKLAAEVVRLRGELAESLSRLERKGTAGDWIFIDDARALLTEHDE